MHSTIDWFRIDLGRLRCCKEPKLAMTYYVKNGRHILKSQDALSLVELIFRALTSL